MRGGGSKANGSRSGAGFGYIDLFYQIQQYGVDGNRR